MIRFLLHLLVLIMIVMAHPSIAMARDMATTASVKQQTAIVNPQKQSDNFLRLSKGANESLNDLGPLKELPGTWFGKGWNLIAVPINNNGKESFRLEIRPYVETITFAPVGALVPNKGFPKNSFVSALSYDQRVTDAKTDQPLHAEDGMWLLLKNQPNLNELSIARQSSIPHGNSLSALGGFISEKGAPTISDLNALPILADNAKALGYSDPYLNTSFPNFDPTNPNKNLQDTIKNQNILETVTLKVSTNQSGGISNIPFIKKNADVTSFDSTFWIESIKDKQTGKEFLQLQYSQQTNLDFLHDFTSNNPDALIVWPHVDISTLVKQ